MNRHSGSVTLYGSEKFALLLLVCVLMCVCVCVGVCVGVCGCVGVLCVCVCESYLIHCYENYSRSSHLDQG